MTDQILKIAGNNINNPAYKGYRKASDYINYGSYSGADIKVIVHLPYSSRARKENLARIDEQIIEVDAAFNQLCTYNEKRKLAKQLEVLKEERAAIDDMGFGSTTEALGNLQTISWSIFREKTPVRRLGSVYPKSFGRGQRTIAGTMIFTLFNTYVLSKLMEKSLHYYSTGQMDKDFYTDSTVLLDQLPPLDISLVAANEYGAISHMGLYGVEFVSDGGTFSIEDIFSEVTVQYVARDFDPLRVVGKRQLDDKGIVNKWTAKTASLLADDNAHLLRRNPFN